MGGDSGSSGWLYKLKGGRQGLVLPQHFGGPFSLEATVRADSRRVLLLALCPCYHNYCPFLFSPIVSVGFRRLSSFNLVVVCFGVRGRIRIYVSSQPPWVSEVTKDMSSFQCFWLFAYFVPSLLMPASFFLSFFLSLSSFCSTSFKLASSSWFELMNSHTILLLEYIWFFSLTVTRTLTWHVIRRAKVYGFFPPSIMSSTFSP